jgi:5-methylcytosine-specific restriction endonuclease McrA
MPIKPENKKLYPKNWKEIREKILKRANNCCEFCGLPNHIEGYRTFNGKFISCNDVQFLRKKQPFKKIKIVLTIAHLDHNPQNNEPSNLRALCQKCHNNYDIEHRKETRRKTKLLSEVE